MTPRELYDNIMHYRNFDRMPVLHWTGWPETMERWYREGLPRDGDQHEFFGSEPLNGHGFSLDNELFPRFEEETIEETPEYRIFRQSDGVIAQHYRGQSALPHYIDFILKDSSGWPEYKKRLQPDPARIPADLDDRIAKAIASNRPITIGTASMVGFLRNWMGVNNFCVACCEDPEFIAEVSDTIATLVCWILEQVLPKMRVAQGWGWEDICFKTGPLVPPSVFKQAAVPGYRKISDTLRKYGCDLHVIDSDGKIDELAPLWLEGGVNVMFPIEIGTWNADPMAFRKKYGKELRVIGGINKLVLERDHKAIDDEIERRKPLMAEGGFIPLPDHLMTPGTPLDNYRYYLDKIRELRF
ncbi:MAG: hypothetical protein HZB26_07095 [Candidatus Hydrogenedentes bacterium]|nr:hypothetical protein [Candidatus Hydrogenedentota bacterium]